MGGEGGDEYYIQTQDIGTSICTVVSLWDVYDKIILPPITSQKLWWRKYLTKHFYFFFFLEKDIVSVQHSAFQTNKHIFHINTHTHKKNTVA